MPDRYSEAEVEAMRGTRPHPLAHVIDPRIVQFNEERRRWLATLDAAKAERDAATARAERAEGALWRIAKGISGRRADGETSNETDWQIARTALARVGKGGA